MQKKIELSKETLRELTMRPLTDEELKLAAGGDGHSAGHSGSTNCTTKLASCGICYEF